MEMIMTLTDQILSVSPFAVPGRTALAGRLTLHAQTNRNEEMYYYLCFEWEQLVQLLQNPALFFRVLQNPTGTVNPIDTLASPITAIIKPVSQSMLDVEINSFEAPEENHEVDPQGDVPGGVTSSLGAVMKLFLDRLPVGNNAPASELDASSLETGSRPQATDVKIRLGDVEPGWFMAEFANRTHLVTIHYCKPPTPKNRYSQNYTEATIGQFGASAFAHVHFDLDLRHDADFEKEVANYVVDHLEDRGARQCATMNTKATFEVGKIDPVFDQTGTPTPKAVTLPSVTRNRNFVTEASSSGQDVSMVIEGLSMTINGLMPDGRETFVCSVNEANLPNGIVVMKDGVLKRYIAP